MYITEDLKESKTLEMEHIEWNEWMNLCGCEGSPYRVYGFNDSTTKYHNIINFIGLINI